MVAPTKEYARAKRAEKAALGLCCFCSNEVSDNKSRCDLCIDRQKTKALAVKLETFNAYGGPACACCAESNMEFLQLDHVHNNGAAHRRENPGLGGFRLYSLLKSQGFPPGFQVLCANCNWAKRTTGSCPHKQSQD